MCPVPGGTGHGCWTTPPIIDALEPEVLSVAGNSLAGPPSPSRWTEFPVYLRGDYASRWNADSGEAFALWSRTSDTSDLLTSSAYFTVFPWAEGFIIVTKFG